MVSFAVFLRVVTDLCALGDLNVFVQNGFANFRVPANVAIVEDNRVLYI